MAISSGPMQSLTNSDNPLLIEWTMVVNVAQHFNDLLMRLRAFGLPIVGTIAGAGFTLGGDDIFSDVPGWVSGAFVTATALALALLAAGLLWIRRWGAAADSIPMTAAEKAMWLLVPATGVAAATCFWVLVSEEIIHLTHEYSLSARPVVLFFALAVLVVLYVLDRFYYYKLLMGAVNRATQLEEQLNFHMTRTITDYVLPQQAATTITLLYFVPGAVGFCLLLVLLGFGPLITHN